MAPPTLPVHIPAYASLPEDSFAPWPLDPCAKRPRLDVGCTRPEMVRVSCEDAGQPWVEEDAGLKQRREWHHELPPKRRRLLRDFVLPVPLSGPKPLEPGQNEDSAFDGLSTFDWGDLSGIDIDLEGSTTAEEETPTCTAVVPYREPLGFWAWTQGSSGSGTLAQAEVASKSAEAEARHRYRELDASRLPIPRSPPLPLQVAEVAVHGETTAVLPDFAAQHRGKPGAEEQIIPWTRDLAIVVYRGPGCNIEPNSRSAPDTASMDVT